MTTFKLGAFLCLLILAITSQAHARVALDGDKFIASMGFSNCTMFVDGCQWSSNMTGVADKDALAEESFYKTIIDGAKIGIQAFGFDATANGANMPWRLERFSTAMKRYNNANPASKRCIYIIYEYAGGEALNMFNAADSNNSADSPYCAVDGKPMIGTWSPNSCVNPLPDLSGKGTFAAIITIKDAANNVATKACVDTLKSSGASRVFNYLWISGNLNLTNSTTYSASKAAAESAGSEFVMGIPSARANQCGGDNCGGARDTNYLFRDGKGYQAALQALRAPLLNSGITRMMYTMSHAGDWGEDSSWEGGKICDENDTVPHNVSIGGINTNFTCPNVPDYLRGTIPMNAFFRSYTNKSFTKRGFNRIGQVWKDLFNGTGSPDASPFIAWAYREHPFAINASGFSICPTAQAQVDANSLGGTSGAGADNLYLTSYSPDPVRVRVTIGSTVVGTYTLPVRQAMLDTDARQQVIAFGSNRGRPKFDVLDSAGNVIKSVTGDVNYTDTPIQRTGTTGRNYSVYADYMDIPGPQAASASITKASADRAEGNSGTSMSDFTVRLTGALPSAIDIPWSVSSSQADVNDFYQIDEVPQSGQCADPPPSPAVSAGFTRLAFCEDFSNASRINLDGNLNSGQTLTQVKPGNIFNSSLMPKSAFVFNADGTMTVNPTRTNYQVDLISTVPTGGGGFSGYAMDGAGWYAEIRWKHSACSKSTGFPAFWSMGTGKLYAGNAPNYEPDFYEYIGQKLIQSLHYYPQAGNNNGRVSINNSSNMPASPTSFFTAGALSSSDGTKYSWYFNNAQTKTATVGYPSAFKSGKYPIMFGSGDPSCQYTVDWVKVWR